MKKKTGPLKHYRRKRFFYKFFLRDSPRSAELFGMGLLSLGVILYLCTRPLALAFATASPFPFIANLLLYRVLLFFGIAFLIVRHNGVRHFHGKELLSLRFLRKMRHYLFLLLALLMFLYWPQSVPVLLAEILLIQLFAVFAPDSRKIKWFAFVPVALATAAVLAMGILSVLLPRHMAQQRALLGSKTGCGELSIESYDRRDQAGFPVDAEPAKTLFDQRKIASLNDIFIPCTPEEARNHLDSLNENGPSYLEALDDFLAMPPGFISQSYHSETETWSVYCSFLRTAAEVPALTVIAGRDKEVIAACNSDLQKLRTWCIHSHSLYARIHAASLEQLRLEALALTLPRMAWSRREYGELLGEEPDWDAAFLYALGDEAVLLEKGIDARAQNWRDRWGEGTLGQAVGKFVKMLPAGETDVFRLYFLLDGSYCLKKLLAAADILQRKDISYRKKYDLLKEWNRPSGFFDADIFFHNEFGAYHLGRVKNKRLMAVLAFEVMEYYRKNRKLPDDLQAFSPPLDVWGNRPFGYEKGDLTVSPDVRRYGFKISVCGVNRDQKNDLLVFLEPAGGAAAAE